MFVRPAIAALLVTLGCGHNPDTGSPDAAVTTDGAADAHPACTGTPTECATLWEQAASDKFDSLLGDPTALAVFLKGVPKGGDLHNHLTGAVYAETYLDWGK
ncbi:MAG TPA: hypothetical protein VF403_19135, partial [Kofleriaceae bacterium]